MQQMMKERAEKQSKRLIQFKDTFEVQLFCPLLTERVLMFYSLGCDWIIKNMVNFFLTFFLISEFIFVVGIVNLFFSQRFFFFRFAV